MNLRSGFIYSSDVVVVIIRRVPVHFAALSFLNIERLLQRNLWCSSPKQKLTYHALYNSCKRAIYDLGTELNVDRINNEQNGRQLWCKLQVFKR